MDTISRAESQLVSTRSAVPDEATTTKIGSMIHQFLRNQRCSLRNHEGLGYQPDCFASRCLHSPNSAMPPVMLYNLNGIFGVSEGTTGTVTETIIKLAVRPKQHSVAVVSFDNFWSALRRLPMPSEVVYRWLSSS